jgi:hypothetical protein
VVKSWFVLENSTSLFWVLIVASAVSTVSANRGSWRATRVIAARSRALE